MFDCYLCILMVDGEFFFFGDIESFMVVIELVVYVDGIIYLVVVFGI